MKKLSVVVPMYYEEKVAMECYKRLFNVMKTLEGYDYEFVFINDGSKDKTLNILEGIAELDKKVKVISFSKNFGHQCAVTAGIKYVTGDAVVIIDADLQDPPEVIPEMVQKWEEGYDVIYGQRKKREGEKALKLLTAKMFYQTLSKISEVDIPKDTGDFRLVDRKVIDVVNSLPEHNKFLRGLYSWVGFKQYAYMYERKERFAGKTKYSVKKMLRLASDGIFGFSNKPVKYIRRVAVVSFLVSLALAIYSIVAVCMNLTYLNLVATSIISAIAFFASLQLGAMWALGEYITRTYDETRNRPQYIVERTINVEE